MVHFTRDVTMAFFEKYQNLKTHAVLRKDRAYTIRVGGRLGVGRYWAAIADRESRRHAAFTKSQRASVISILSDLSGGYTAVKQYAVPWDPGIALPRKRCDSSGFTGFYRVLPRLFLAFLHF